MTKKDVIWLLIRIAGFYFLWQGVEIIINMISTLVLASGTPNLMAGSGGVFLKLLLQISLYFGLGLYMLVNGSLFFHMFSREPEFDD